MAFSIKDDWLRIDGLAAPRFDTPHVGGRMAPSLIVMHDTAGRLTRGSSVAWFMDAASKVSAHFVVERDGSVTQMAPCDRQCWHAGDSEWRGRRHVNGFAIGIEIVNPGRLVAKGSDRAVAWFGEVFDRASCGIHHRATDQHGDGLWMAYTAEQIATIDQLIDALAAAYPSIREVVGHYQISPGRKVDPCPLLPARLLGPVRRPRPVAPDPVSVREIQTRMRALGYFPGEIDGEAGPRTETAVFAFQRQNGIAATGTIDAATSRAIMSEAAKPMPTASREWLTEVDVAPTSRTVTEQQGARSDAQIVTGLGVATTIMGLLTSAGQMIKQAVIDFGGEVVLIVVGGAAAAYGVRNWRRAWRTIGYRIADARSGVHAGGGGDDK